MQTAGLVSELCNRNSGAGPQLRSAVMVVYKLRLEEWTEAPEIMPLTDRNNADAESPSNRASGVLATR